MAKTKLENLNDHLFLQLERLNDNDLTAEGMKSETIRTQAITSLSKEVVSLARVALDGSKFIEEYGDKLNNLPKQFKQN